VSEEYTILLCTDYLPPGGGGVEVVVDTLARQLVERGHSVEVLTLATAENGQPTLVDHEDVTVHQFPTLDLTNVIGLQSQFSPAVLTRFGGLVRKIGADIVHVHNRFFFTTVAAALWKTVTQAETPLVTTLHLGPVDDIGGLAGLSARSFEHGFGRLLLRASDITIAVSEAVGGRATSLGAKSSQVRTIYNGVDPEQFHPSETNDGKTLLFVGRLIRNKGPQVFVRALPAVLDAHPDAKVQLVGTGPMRDDLETLASNHDVADAVTFRGHIPSVADAMRDAAVFCRPSFSEGLPLTLLEAMASGLPAVVTPVAGVPEVVDDGTTGYLVPTDDSDALGQTLSELLADREQRTAVGTAARDYVVKNHSWTARTEKVMQVYREVLE
jgi:glycosyltransferase involved in cell wall biosynthesis